MLALIADHKERRLKLEERPMPVVNNPNDVIVKMRCTGVCGCDVAIITGRRWGEDGIVNGHEGVGEVVEVGSSVDNLSVGDQVLLQPNISCKKCESCVKYRGINHNFCEEHATYGIHCDGAMAEYACFPNEYLRKLPDGFTSLSAVLAEPLACIVHGMKKLPESVSSILVMGSGISALLWIQVLLYKGHTNVTCYSRSVEKSGAALKLGCREVLTGSIDKQDVHKRLEFDLIIECTGATECVEWGVEHLARNGTFIIYGTCPENEYARINPYKMWEKETKILSSLIYDEGEELDEAIETTWNLEKQGLLKFEDFNIGVHSFENIEEGWTKFLRKEISKLVIVPSN